MKKLVLMSSLVAMVMSQSAVAFDLGFDQGNKDASGAVTGSAGTNGAQGEAPSLEKCAKPLGKIALNEPQDEMQKMLSSFKLQSPTGLIRMMIQQSGCFLVVERGVAMKNLMQERALAEAGQARSGSNMGKGQLAAADYVLTPEIVFSNGNAGGIGGAVGAIGGLFGPLGTLAGAVAGGVKFKQAQTTLLLADVRSGVQVAASQGSSEKTDWALGGLLGGAGAAGSLGGYANTAEGKVVAAAFLDAYNGIVRSVRGAGELTRDSKSLKAEAGTVVKAGAVFQEGDTLQPKIGKVGVRAEASAKAKVVGQWKKGDEAVTDGREDNGFIFVTGDGFAGWVDRNMVRKTGS